MADLAQGLNKELTEIIEPADGNIDLAKAALHIARIEYPNLDESFYMNQLEELALRLKGKIAGERAIHALAAALSRFLAEEEGFKGNTRDYYNSDNSFLNRVLERRVGIPISLCLVYQEVGRRAGLDIRGIGMPGHFIAGVHGAEGRVLIDPFYKGRILTEEECRTRVRVQYGGAKSFTSHTLDPVEPKPMLARLLRNLKGIYTQMEEKLKVFQVVEWILLLEPDAAQEHKERAIIYEELGAYDRTVRDFKRYLELSPNAEDRELIENKIEGLKGEVPQFH